ncbi:DAPG hydrolase family protein [Falsirhodobacter sp. 1013]|uniref:DAPG hydrolase family protein n=1 Tax=Falsirhodobacter sp. 1013 TaxID=3417566 RepID=UPI003EBDCD93
MGATALRAQDAASETDAGSKSAVTYMPILAQRQFVSNAKAIKATPYADFFTGDLTVSTDFARSLQLGTLDKAETLPPSVAGLNALLDLDHSATKNGYAVLDGSTSYVQSRHVMPGVSAEMLRWWFTWHEVERERYSLWFPHAHIENSVQDPQRLQDRTKTYEQRLYDNPNYVKELVGPTAMELLIRFKDPAKLGFDAKAFSDRGFIASASGIVGPATADDVINSMMIHIARDTDQGMELVSRYWIGAHPDLARFEGAEKAAGMMAQAGYNDSVAEMSAYELAVHDMIEFTHLASFLPALHARFGQE